ncbi:MAG: DMT family transporter [Pirellulaceae bacterium]|nr:DMT family transporter [Pirellulaceae bacterium]
MQPSSLARPSAHHDWVADGLLLFTALLWGINIVVFKAAITGTNAYVFNALRLLFAVSTLVVMAAIEWQLYPAIRVRMRTLPWLTIALYCLLNGVIYLLAYVQGISLTTAGNVALIFASLPMWTAGMSMLLFNERLPGIVWTGLLITAVGTGLIILNGAGQVSLSSQYLTGNLFVLIATLAWGSATILSRNLLRVLTPLQLAAFSSLATTPIHWCIAWQHLPDVLRTSHAPGYWAAMAYSGVFSTGIAYAAWNAGVRRAGASYASIYQNVVTLVAVLGGWWLLREQLLAVQIIGGVMTIAGLLLMRRARYQAHC